MSFANQLETQEQPRVARKHSLRIFLLLGFGAGLILLCAAALLLLFGDINNPTVRRVLRRVATRHLDRIEPRQNVVDCSLASIDLRNEANVIPTLRFNLRTRWPSPAKLPPGLDPRQLLTNAMNPGLGVRELHRQGITGNGVGVAIIDYPLLPDHPEYSAQLAAYHDLSGQSRSSMHGPAVASLLVGAKCGTAPGARLYYAATPDPGEGVQDTVRALDWILETNSHLPEGEKIRVISISASPDGERVLPRPNPGGPWPSARRRAEEAGVMVLDFARESAFIGPCEYDPGAPEDITRCKPILAKDRPDFFAEHLLVPVAPRTTAEEYDPHSPEFQYCGIGGQTFRYHGVSWAAPYCAGVLALGWQLRPDLTPAQMRALLFRSASALPTGEKVINPMEFIRLVRIEPRSLPQRTLSNAY
jgi:hypothetical protein